MTRRALTLALAACLIPGAVEARKRYRVFVRRIAAKPPEPALEPAVTPSVRTVRIIPLPGRLVPTWKEHWLERISGTFGFK